MTYSHCTDGEFFRGNFSTPDEAAADAFHDDDDLESVEVGENIEIQAHIYVSADSILDDIACRASEECGEIADDWLTSLMSDEEKRAELEKLVGDWIEANEPPTFWRIGSTRRISRAEIVAAGLLKEAA